MPKLSVLIPIYNVEKYLPTCLDSVFSQTLEDIEIICINDGSTDNSGKILAEYAAKDTRIRIIDKQNTGYGHSMNVGMEHAKGEYIGIVESDDYISREYFEKLFTIAKSNDLDVAKCECSFSWPSEDYYYRYHEAGLDRYYGQIFYREKLWLRCQFLMNIWTGIYRRDFLISNNIHFNESPGASYQDNGFWLQTMIFADKVMVIPEEGYFYRQDNEAASIKDVRKVYAMTDEFDWMAKCLEGRVSQDEMDVVNTFRLTRGYWNLIRIADEVKREFCDKLIDDYKSYGRVFFKDILWQERFEKIKDDPDGFCESLRLGKEQAKELIDGASDIAIYGAGRRGEMLYRILCNYGWSNKLRCFLETKESSIKQIGRIPVFSVDSIGERKDDSLVIISAAAGTAMEAAMKKELEKRSINNVITSDSIIDFFYLVC